MERVRIEGVPCEVTRGPRGVSEIRFRGRGGGRSIPIPRRIDLSWATPFQRRVLKRLARVRRGFTITYGELARAVGSSARAVGQAVGSNRLPLVFP